MMDASIQFAPEVCNLGSMDFSQRRSPSGAKPLKELRKVRLNSVLGSCGDSYRNYRFVPVQL